MAATIHSINVSQGGVPKLPVPEAQVTPTGLVGDRQKHTKFHGGPTRAVSLLGLDLIRELQDAGHPIVPGATGENLTIAGLEWRAIPLGTTFHFEGGVVLEALSHATPCPTIRRAFAAGEIELLDARKHAGQARIYASVRVPGVLRRGESVRLESPPAERLT
jgi:MOSC domain-containing protein YiiM